jgi:hypothetical protein
MSDQKYTITVTPAQAQIMQAALEVYARLGFCQIWPALDQLPVLVDGNRKSGGTIDHDTIRAVEDLLSPKVGLNMRSSSLGVGNRNASPGSDDAWSMYTVIRHRLAWDEAIARGDVGEMEPRNWTTMMAVHFDEPHRYGKEPAAKIERAA